MLALALGIASMGSAYALKADSHVWVGQQVINDLARDRAVTIRLNGRLVKIAPPADVIDAILQNKNEFLMGNIGPDAAPDVIVGQSIVHPGAVNPGDWGTHQWLQYLLANSKTSSVGKAYAYGYLGHAAADMFSHTYINQYAGDIWNLFDNETLVEERHMALEAFIAKMTPPLLDQNGAALGNARTLVKPKEALWPYLRDTLVMNDTVADQYGRRSAGKHLAAYYDYRKLIGRLAVDWVKVDTAVQGILVNKYNGPLSQSQAQSIINKMNTQVLPALNSGIDNVQGYANEINTIALNADQRVFNVVLDANQKMISVNNEIIDLHVKLLQQTAILKPIKNCPAWYLPGYVECNSYNAAVNLNNSTINATISVINSTLKTKQTALLSTAVAVRDAAVATNNFFVVIANAQVDLAQRFGSNLSPVTSLLDGWGKDIDVAMSEYVRAANQVILNSTDLSLSGEEVFAPLSTWFRCYHMSIIGVPQELGGCTVSDAAKKASDAVDRLTRLVDDLGSLNGVVGLPSSPDMHLIEGAKNRLISAAAENAIDKLPPGIRALITISHEDMSDAALDAYFTTTELRLTKHLLMIPDVAARVRAEMKVTNGYFDPQGYAVVADAVQLAKLALLDRTGLDQLAAAAGVPIGSNGLPVFSATDNVVASAFASIDGNHQWMSVPPVRPNDGGIAYYQPPSYAAPAGFTPWRSDVRNQLFRSLFKGPLSPGIEDAGEIGFPTMLKTDYPYRPTLAYPFPDDVAAVVNAPDKTALSMSPVSLNFGTVQRGGTKSLPVTVTNTGPIPATGLTFSIVSTGSGGDLHLGSNCGTTLANGASCTVNVAFDGDCVGGTVNGHLNAAGDNLPAVSMALTAVTSRTGMCL